MHDLLEPSHHRLHHYFIDDIAKANRKQLTHSFNILLLWDNSNVCVRMGQVVADVIVMSVTRTRSHDSRIRDPNPTM